MKEVGVVAGLAAVYFMAGKLGLRLAFVHPSATPVWPPTGIALAAFLLLGNRVWPGIFLGAFLVNLTTAGTVATSIGIATGNTLEGLTGAYLLNRWAHGRYAMDRARDVLKFAFLAGMLSTAVSATLGVTSLCLGGYARWANYDSIWLTWWLGDAVGDVVVAPLLLLWSARPRLRWDRDRFIEASALLVCLFFVSQVVFEGLVPSGIKHYPLQFLCYPFLVWAAFRLGPREVATATLVMSVVAIHGTLRGLGPFGTGATNVSLLLVQVFVGVTGMVAMAVAASVSERKRAADIFRLVVESAPNAMVTVGGQGKIVLVNSQTEKLFGYSREELIGQPIEILVPQRFRGNHPGFRAGFVAQPRARPMGAGRDLYAVRKDGSEFPVEIGLNPIETEEGTLVLSAIVDITERKAAEERFRLVVESAPNAMVVVGGQGKIVLVNSQTEKLFGYSREELIGQSIEILVPQRFRGNHPGFRAGFVAQPRARPMGAGRDLYAVRKDGSEFPVEIGLNPIETEEGTLVLSAIVDITERKRAELLKQEANEKLMAWVCELEQRSREITLVNQMSQLLQTCLTPQEACAAVGQFARELFPNDSGAVCVLNASVYLVETVSVWGESPPSEQVFSPQECWALRRGQVHSVQDARSSLLCQHLRDQPLVNSLCVPMVAQGEALGVLHLRGSPQEASQPEEVQARQTLSREQLAVTVAGHIALALGNLRLRETLRTQSIRDPLTGLYNRRYLKESLEREVRRAARNQRSLALIMLDIDRFKGFNDTFGHDAADALLRELGSFLQKRTRGEDIACRYGGDEFVLILAEASVAAAERRAQQLREGIKHLTVPHGEQYLRPPTVSLGVALYPEHGSTAEGLLRAADEALYSAKAGGRDRVALGQATDLN